MKGIGAWIVVGVFAATVFAGCLETKTDDGAAKTKNEPKKLGAVDPATYVDKLSKPVYDLAEMVKENVKVASFDQKRMDNWVYRPKTNESTKVPVFINFSPYWTNLAPSGEAQGDAFSKYMIEYFVPRGYAVVLASVRGTGYSEGCFNIGGEVERKDAVAVIEYFAKQPWSNGNIAAGGKSYDGTTPQGAAIMNPPALKAIFPVSGISELYKYNYKGGIPYGNGADFNRYYFMGVGMDQYGKPKTDQPTLIVDDVACPYLPEMQANGYGSAVTGDYTPYWQERNYTKDAAKVTAALFFVHGFTDWNVKPDHIMPWLGGIQAPMKVWLHNWTANERSSDGHVYPRRDDWNQTMLRFLDETLKGIDTGIFDEPAFQIQDSTGKWRWEESWPPVDAMPTRFSLTTKDGKATLDPAGGAKSGAPRAYVDSPGAGGAGGLCNQIAGQGFVRYESPILEQELHYAGVPTVHLQARSDRPFGEVIATLCSVGPDGRGVMINWGGLNLRHRIALENPQPVLPDTLYGLQFPLFPQDDVVPAGNKLVLILAGTGGQYSSLLTGNTITFMENDRAYLELPIQTQFSWEEPQPVRIPCFAC